MTNLISLVNSLEDEEVILFTTDFLFELTNQLKDFLVSYGFSENDLTSLMATEARRKYSQIGGVFNLNGQADLTAVWPDDNGKMHQGLQGIVGPVDLGGEKSGFQFQVQFYNFYRGGKLLEKLKLSNIIFQSNLLYSLLMESVNLYQ